MTDLEIDKALALAIGWAEWQITTTDAVYININPDNQCLIYDVFSHKDPAVIWTIAERYDCFPYRHGLSWDTWVNIHADTAAKAVALAVIGMKK